MKKLLRPQDVLLLGIAGAIDVFSEFQSVFGVAREAYRNIYGWVPDRFKETHHFQVLYHSLKTGYLEKVIKDGKVYLRITSKGQKIIERDFPFLSFQTKKWDGKWRVVVFDIQEKQKRTRDVLRLKLKELGFGMLQESVWVSPHDIAFDFRQFVKSQGLGEEVFVMDVNELLAGNSKELVKKIWSIEKINETYEELFYILTKLRDRDKTSISTEVIFDKKEKDKVREVRSRYLEILVNDPMLPKELLPNNWYGEKVKKLIEQLKN